MGQIVSKEGVRIDPNWVVAIDRIPIPKIVKSIQSFFWQINFVMRLISKFLDIFKPISRMLKKGAKLDWTSEVIDVFIAIKQAIKEAPILKSLDFSKPF